MVFAPTCYGFGFALLVLRFSSTRTCHIDDHVAFQAPERLLPFRDGIALAAGDATVSLSGARAHTGEAHAYGHSPVHTVAFAVERPQRRRAQQRQPKRDGRSETSNLPTHRLTRTTHDDPAASKTNGPSGLALATDAAPGASPGPRLPFRGPPARLEGDGWRRSLGLRCALPSLSGSCVAARTAAVAISRAIRSRLASVESLLWPCAGSWACTTAGAPCVRMVVPGSCRLARAPTTSAGGWLPRREDCDQTAMGCGARSSRLRRSPPARVTRRR